MPSSTEEEVDEALHGGSSGESSDGADETSGAGDETKLNTNELSSSYWRYFDKDSDEKATCRLCSKSISRKRQSTKGLRSHLKSVHKKWWRELDASRKVDEVQKQQQAKKRERENEPQMRQLKLFEQPPPPAVVWPNDDPRSQRMDYAVLRWICLSCRPLRSTEEPGFAELLNIACPSYTVKGRNGMTALLESEYSRVYEALKARVRQDESTFYSFTTDAWSSKNQKHSFLSLTLHYITPSMERQFAVLDTADLAGRAHKADVFAEMISTALDSMQIPLSSIHLVVRDAAWSMKRTARLLCVDSFDCFAHKMQLAITDGMKNGAVAEVIAVVKGLVKHYNHSTPFQNLVHKTQRQQALNQRELIQDVETRWNSTYYMVERVLQEKTVLTLVALEYKQCDALNQLSGHWETMETLLAILQPFEVLTKTLSSRNEAISSVLPAYFALLHGLLPNDRDDQWAVEFKSRISSGLSSRMIEYVREPFLVVATVLDPRYKLAVFQSEADKRQAKLLLQLELEKLVNAGDPSQVLSPVLKQVKIDFEKDPIGAFMSTGIPQEPEDEPRDARIESELSGYFREAAISRGTDPLVWWRANRSYVLLKELARRFLAAPPTSVESERVFSTMGGIYTPKRSKLKGEHAKQQLFLHHHL